MTLLIESIQYLWGGIQPVMGMTLIHGRELAVPLISFSVSRL